MALLGHRVLQGLAGLEHGQLGLGDGDLLAGAGVAAHPGGPGLYLEGAKAHQLNLLPLALAGAMFLLSRWMRQGLALREDNDSII